MMLCLLDRPVSPMKHGGLDCDKVMVIQAGSYNPVDRFDACTIYA